MEKIILTNENWAVGLSSCLLVEYHGHSKYVSRQHVMMRDNYGVWAWRAAAVEMILAEPSCL